MTHVCNFFNSEASLTCMYATLSCKRFILKTSNGGHQKVLAVRTQAYVSAQLYLTACVLSGMHMTHLSCRWDILASICLLHYRAHDMVCPGETWREVCDKHWCGCRPPVRARMWTTSSNVAYLRAPDTVFALPYAPVVNKHSGFSLLSAGACLALNRQSRFVRAACHAQLENPATCIYRVSAYYKLA